MMKNFFVFAFVQTALVVSLSAEKYAFNHEGILGTSMELVVDCENQAMANRAEALCLKEIDRLNRIFSTYDPATEISHWLNSRNEAVPVSPEMLQLFQKSTLWEERSEGAFSTATPVLTDLWKRAAARHAIPTAQEIDQALSEMRQDHWLLNEDTRKLTRLSSIPLNLDAIAKGFIIDRVGETMETQLEGVQNILLNIGGDMRIFGQMEAEVAVTHPFDGVDNHTAEIIVVPGNMAIASSGGYRRGFDIQGKHFSHIFDARTGYPVGQTVSATVIAKTAADSDALATIFSVIGGQEALTMVETLPEVDCMIIAEDGTRYASKGWNTYLRSPAFDEKIAYSDSIASPERTLIENEKNWAEEWDFVVNFELSRISDNRYRRPYVAVWITDEEKVPVRTLCLWMGRDRWLPDLRSWYRDDRFRQLVDNTDLVSTTSTATRPPGKYKLKWDGKDDSGKLLKPGKYFIQIEATREHGTYQLMKTEFEISDKPFNKTLKGNVEVKSATVDFRKKSSI